jgi:hypothetical protein
MMHMNNMLLLKQVQRASLSYLLLYGNRLQPQHLAASRQTNALAAGISCSWQPPRQPHISIVMCKVNVLHLPAAARVVKNVHTIVAEGHHEEACCG